MRAVPEHRPEDLLGATEAAAIIGIDRSSLTRWMDKGWITPARRLTSSNGALLFHRADVERGRDWHAARIAGPTGATA